jgi:quinone-modifying oxidoreductase, subunit QmoC
MFYIKPDIDFKERLITSSKSELNKCMQCGECTVVCSLAPESRPFPRKEMVWAGWGLKDKLMGNPDIWLCHQCGDCTEHCPRGVKPSDVIASVRQFTYKHYARPKFLGKLLSTPALLPVALLIPLVIILAILYIAGTLGIPEGPVNYSKLFPHALLNSSFMVLTFITIAFTVSGLTHFWKDMQRFVPETDNTGGFMKSFFFTLKEIALHRKFRECTGSKVRFSAHLLVFYGFILLLFVTVFAIVAVITHNYPLSPGNPFKILGNIAALMLTTGCGIMIYQRIFNKEKAGSGNYTDWIFLVVLLVLTLTGVILEIARFNNWSVAYYLYIFHLVLVWFIVIYLPYTKFGHMLYRTLALIYCNMKGRE